MMMKRMTIAVLVGVLSCLAWAVPSEILVDLRLDETSYVVGERVRGVVEVRNKGTKPLDMCAVYFRPQSPFALESVAKIPPNMWKRPCEARWQAADGRWFGARSTAATARRFSFVCNAERRSQHPDACFEPETAQVLSPGAAYRPNGTMWCRIEGGAHLTASR